MNGGVRVSVRSNIKSVTAEFQTLRSDITDKATYRALNRAIDKVATETGREIRKEYNVKQRAIRSALRKVRAHKGRGFARLVVEGFRLGLIEFDARHSRRQAGASVRIKVKGGRKIVAGSFIAAATANNYQGGGSMGMRQVWRRVGKERYPIKTLRSISVPQAFMNKAVLTALERAAIETFDKNFRQQIRYLSGVV